MRIFLFLFFVSFAFAEQPVNQRCPIGRNTPGLKGHWKFDESSGSTTKDSSPYYSTGTLYSATFVTGKFGNAVLFDNEDLDAVGVGTATNINLSDPMTMTAWIKFDGAGAENSFCTFFAAENLAFWFSYQADGDHPDELTFYDGAWRYGTGGLPASQWTFVVITVDGTNTRFYTNGALVGTDGGQGIADNATSHKCMGARTRTGSNSWETGILDDVSVYNRVWTADEIKAEYYKKARYYD